MLLVYRPLNRYFLLYCSLLPRVKVKLGPRGGVLRASSAKSCVIYEVPWADEIQSRAPPVKPCSFTHLYTICCSTDLKPEAHC